MVPDLTFVIFSGILLTFGLCPRKSVATASTWDKVRCAMSSPDTCCMEPPKEPQVALKYLSSSLKTQLFGQHIAFDTVLYAVAAHLRGEPEKPLVLSFHGWAGTGKTFLSRLIYESMYEKGQDSEFVHTFQGSLHFPDNAEAEIIKYKKFVQSKIRQMLKWCDRPIFIFDEVDQTPAKVFDALVPFLDQTRVEKGLSQRRAIFIFLSNIGALSISEITLQAWKDGKARESLALVNFEAAIQQEAFNSPSGFFKSRLLERHLITYFVPFLPMERRHVKECVVAESARFYSHILDSEKILDELLYWPNDLKLFSITGCKRVSNLVKFHVEKQRIHDEF